MKLNCFNVFKFVCTWNDWEVRNDIGLFSRVCHKKYDIFYYTSDSNFPVGFSTSALDCCSPYDLNPFVWLLFNLIVLCRGGNPYNIKNKELKLREQK